jgi:alpha-beta hydrolase superfamily lysophospholipase
VLKHLLKLTSEHVEIVLWGRSMGAVTLVRYMSENKTANRNVRVVVLDSPFQSLQSLIVELVNQKIKMPKFLIEMFLKYLEPEIE